jgi:hypothetical protein
MIGRDTTLFLLRSVNTISPDAKLNERELPVLPLQLSLPRTL